MPKWTKPSEGVPDILCGDRILIIVRECRDFHSPPRPTIVILEATEDGWDSPDDTYAGYSVHDGELWAYERDVAAIADVVSA